MGTLYYGDNLDVRRRYAQRHPLDSVYLAPPLDSAEKHQ